ncbi:MAG: TRAP transporter large permease [Vicinamibacterales bacterium]
MIEALYGFAALFALIFLRVPIAVATLIVGGVGFAAKVGTAPALAMVAQITYDTGLTYGFSVLPLFILMGNFVNRAGFSDELYAASYAFLGHRRGGLAMATVVACGGLSSISGSSYATAATMVKVAMPPMRRFGYADSLAAGSIAAGGTLGILIPPSIVLVIYGIITETDIGALFVAGIVPGIIGMFGYAAAVAVTTRLRPELGPPGERQPWAARLRSLTGVWGVLVLFALVMGGIYGGVFTPTEAAGIGAAGAFLFALARTRSLRGLFEVFVESGRTTAMIFFVIIGALVFANFINISGLPSQLSGWAQALDVPPIVVVLAIMAVYVVLGCVLESLSMILLTVPTFYPLVIGLGFDPVWFGIIVVVVTEISLITPPIGLNVFVVRSLLPDVATGTIFRGVMPFIAADVVRLLLFIFVPGIILFLPALMLR